MVLKSIWLIVSALFSIEAMAQGLYLREGPYRRTCRIGGGQPWVVKLPADDLELCRFDGAAVSSEAFFNFRVERRGAEAVSAYLRAADGVSCGQAGGEVLVSFDSEASEILLCRFGDGSVIEVQTLELGSGAAENRALTESLASR
ncbi:MAG: hypothetical protein NDJ89_16505 [Oligoflexia bacterium]|nr:hypothetical protein [Oligoflexia bacterium]